MEKLKLFHQIYEFILLLVIFNIYEELGIHLLIFNDMVAIEKNEMVLMSRLLFAR
jgi:hypothetical protein